MSRCSALVFIARGCFDERRCESFPAGVVNGGSPSAAPPPVGGPLGLRAAAFSRLSSLNHVQENRNQADGRDEGQGTPSPASAPAKLSPQAFNDFIIRVL